VFHDPAALDPEDINDRKAALVLRRALLLPTMAMRGDEVAIGDDAADVRLLAGVPFDELLEEADRGLAPRLNLLGLPVAGNT